MSTRTDWITRAETGADTPAIRETDLAAFDTPLEADLVEALRADSSWIDGLSIVVTDQDGRLVGHALLTRCHIDDTPALCLAPVAVLPEYQGTGAGSAAVRTAACNSRHRDHRGGSEHQAPFPLKWFVGHRHRHCYRDPLDRHLSGLLDPGPGR
ncbi:hypothetical protein GCM10020367_20430 [Streptomyces sannanensis]|uniref:N-acetyltransferase domain-containing protein n=1 Tax=Streptomyces sannanensis TaxID=285536 RepID=A0ABP6S8Y6_9ACTN